MTVNTASPPVASPTLPDDLTDAEDFVVGDGDLAATKQAKTLPSTLEEDLTAQLFGEEDDDFGAGLFSDEEKLDDEKPRKQLNQPSQEEADLQTGFDSDVEIELEPATLDEKFLEAGAEFADIAPPPDNVGAIPAQLPAEVASAKQSEPVTEGGKEADYAARGDKMSRYTKDVAGNLVHKWKADYAPRGGGGRAQCRDLDCLERHEQAGVRTIEKGCLRIGRRVLMPGKDGEDGQLTFMWYHARCIFNAFLRARKGTRLIETEEDIEEFHIIKQEDQGLLRRIIAGNEDLRAAKFATGQGSVTTPLKRVPDGLDLTPAKRRKGMDNLDLSAGNRVWTHCRVRAPVAAGELAPTIEIPSKSAKPELAMIVMEPKEGTVIVQFESADHEKERLEKHAQKKFKMIRGWLRYPRIFEGKKQRVPIDWIKSDRPPPKMCGCCKQDWGHCSRGGGSAVWGVSVS